ncbi:MAG TPA: response regulator [Terracidiphilus sp.]|jgi:FixJ family two-component response regulator|nr:response regulator [Terracidiphilus sp.]
MTSVRSDSVETVFIVDDDEATRAGVSDLLESAGLRTQQYSSAEEFLEIWNPEIAGCLVLDVRLPGMSGMELQGHLAESGIALPLIIMTAHGDMPMVRKALKAGAVEFLIKPFQDAELLEAVEQAFALDRSRRRDGELLHSIQARAGTLTERERQVMGMVTAGLTNKEIAEKIFLSVVTVKLHRSQVMRKMQAESLADLVKMSEWFNKSRGSAGG